MQHRTWIWVDTWEINVGDSIVQKIQEAIQEASALIVVLSEASVNSEWCKKELSVGLIRELEEKRVIVLPVLIDDCDIPVFLRDKKYADFRENYDDGLRVTLEAVAKVTSDTQGRIDSPDFHTDWSMDWGEENGSMVLRLTLAEHGESYPYCVITEIVIVPNEVAVARYNQYSAVGLDWVARAMIVEYITESIEGKLGTDLLIENNLPVATWFVVGDPKVNIAYHVYVRCRRMGEDTGKDVLVHWGQELEQVRNTLRAVNRKMTAEETKRAALVLLAPVPCPELLDAGKPLSPTKKKHRKPRKKRTKSRRRRR
jgi:hypothetical protein